MGLYHTIFYLGIYLWFHDSVSADVVISPVNASVIEHRPVTLTCSLTGTTHTAKHFSWYLKKVLQSGIAAVGILTSTCENLISSINSSLYEYACPNNMQSTWTVKNVTRQNHGDRYQCNIETSIGNENSNFTFIDVQVPVSSVTMSASSLSVVVVIENTEAMFKCKTSGSRPEATVTWYINVGTPDDSGDDEEITSYVETSSMSVNGLIEVTSTLRFRPSRNDSGMNIYCMAKNLLGHTPTISTRKPLLNVHYPPVIGELKNRSAVEDASLTVTCPVTVGNPPDTLFVWQRNGLSWKTTQTFTIETISKTDAIFYTCIATNTMKQTDGQTLPGQDAASFYLNVLYQASVISFFVIGHDGQTNVVTEHDENVQFTCAVDSNPASTIKIMFGDTILEQESNTKNLSVVRSQVNCLHGGLYTCEGSNGYGQPSSSSLTLSVKCSPRPLHRVRNNITSFTNVPVTLSFTALAYPNPGPKGFSWYKEVDDEWRPILANADLHITSSPLQSNLTILNLIQSDFGRYRITVINSMGSYDQDFLLSEKGTSNECICTVEADTTNVILGVTLGIVCAVLAIYAASVTILYRRKTCKEKQSRNEPSKERTYANLSFETDVTENPSQRGEQIRTNDQDGGDDKLEMHYTDLVRSSKDDRTTYETIQQTE